MSASRRQIIVGSLILHGSAVAAAIPRAGMIIAGIALGLSAMVPDACRSGERPDSSDALQPVKLVNRVWAVAESPAGATSDLYVFLSEGTFVIASAEAAAPIVGRWSWDGHRLTMSGNSMPYTADILLLTDTEFRLRVNYWNLGSGEILLVPAPQAMPDTARSVEFNPEEYRVFADGSDPSWHLEVEGGVARLRMRAGATVYKDGTWEGEDAHTWIFTAYRHGASGDDTLSLTISTERCVMGPAGATLPMRAYLTISGSEFKGCAIAGK